jgi:hypothetical protein
LESPDKCRKAVIKNTNGANLQFKVHSVTAENPEMWDLALFATPRHPGFNKLKSKETTYLSLDFTTAAERGDFVVAFNKLIKIYSEELDEAERVRKERAYASNCPKRASLPPARRSSSIFSTGSLETVQSPANPASRPPTLARLNFSKFSLS